MRNRLQTLFVVLLGILVVYFVVDDWTTKPTAQHGAGKETTVDALERRIAVLETTLQTLRETQGDLRSDVLALKQKRRNRSPQVAQSKSGELPLPPPFDPSVGEVDDVLQPFPSTDEQSAIKPREVFESEPPDTDRSAALQRKLEGAFKGERLSGVNLQEISCRSTSCRLVVDTTSASSDPHYLLDLEMANAIAQRFPGTVEITDEPGARGGHILYVLESSDRVPQPFSFR